ncbi:uncharacterized protein BDZ83DRAFT_28327 [Colletotrichum acutatum]|uniref:Uncharacterized protein n=1 Tax=Glomerella acutata TaxID=27357 RepID=A0AAD8XBA2_GLOAC|nr:uncharacterized protein BDZ83DRAFT_28327 [Colletotrichum acutatum]KAK1717450.1 hypothetical protein BDZ83DRAFT_28327 [Colletotrichum acutatum]
MSVLRFSHELGNPFPLNVKINGEPTNVVVLQMTGNRLKQWVHPSLGHGAMTSLYQPHIIQGQRGRRSASAVPEESDNSECVTSHVAEILIIIKGSL